MHRTISLASAIAGVLAGAVNPCTAQGRVPVTSPQFSATVEAPMLRGDTAATSAGWQAQPIFTVSESVAGYRPVGLLDGIGAFAGSGAGVDVLINHELNPDEGYAYTLANGTTLTGARVSRFVIGSTDRSDRRFVVVDAELAFDTIYDRSFNEVFDPAQINETGNATDGIARLCSSQGVAAGTYGFVDDVYFTGEETGKPSHPHGGTDWALDVRNRTLWAVPAMGRMAWENVTPLDTGAPDSVALLCGDDTAAAPLYLYVGEKNDAGDFLDRNGLRVGHLYAWKADNGDLSPEDFNGPNASRTGSFVELTVLDPAKAGQAGYDAAGYADIDTLQAQADSLGCFSFSRPEDLATNPLDGTQAVLASTGRGSLFPSDNWGTAYVIDVDFSNLTAELVIVNDGDALAVPDAGIRSPDNVNWATNGKIYAQEDRSTSPSSLFGAVSGVEASVWQIDPVTRAITRIAEIDRSAVAPAGSTDDCAGEIGCWESSGVLDVTTLVRARDGERVLIATVQAHGISDGPIGGDSQLVEGGQLLFLIK